MGAKKKKEKPVYAFIDSQNLNLGVRSQGWKLDFGKFRVYLRDKYRVDKAFLFIGYIPTNQKLYDFLKRNDYILVFKPIIQSKKGNYFRVKGNVDAELVLYSAAIEYLNYDKAVVVSGDGDFFCLYDYLEQKSKLLQIIIPNKSSESSLLSKFQSYKIFLEFEKEKVILLANKNGRRSS